MSSIAASTSSGLSAQLVQAQLAGLRTQSQISTAVARKALDTQQDQGEAIVDLLQNATSFAKATTANPDGSLDVVG